MFVTSYLLKITILKTNKHDLHLFSYPNLHTVLAKEVEVVSHAQQPMTLATSDSREGIIERLGHNTVAITTATFDRVAGVVAVMVQWIITIIRLDIEEGILKVADLIL